MKLLILVNALAFAASALAGVAKRQEGQNTFEQGLPQNHNGSRGSIISGMYCRATARVRSVDVGRRNES